MSESESDFISEDTHLAIKAGIVYLDQHYPNWDMRVKLTTLDLGSGWQCMMGQLEGDYSTWMDKSGRNAVGGTEFGFYPHRGTSFAELTRAWKQVIRERRAERRAAKARS